MPPRVTDIKDKPEREEESPKPPRQPRQPASTTSTGKKRTPNDRKLAEAVAGMYAIVGASVTGVGVRMGDEGLAQSGFKTIELSEQLAEAWLDLADKNPKVKATLFKLTEISSTGVLIGLHLTIALPLLVDRGIIPQSMAMPWANTNGNGSTPTE